MRYGLLWEIWSQTVSNSIAQSKELTIQNPIHFLLRFGSFIVGRVVRFMRYSLLQEIQPQTLDIELRASYKDRG